MTADDSMDGEQKPSLRLDSQDALVLHQAQP
jgi:hypothetical protein